MNSRKVCEADGPNAVGYALLRRRVVWAGAVLGLVPWTSTHAADEPLGGDPLGSSQWPDLKREFIGASGVRFSEHIAVKGPVYADDALNVPLLIDARALAAKGSRVSRIRVVVDRNPIRHVLDFEPVQALPVLAFRLRLEQASPVRALVQTADGEWHAGGIWVQAAGGGCTVPGASRSDGSWSQGLNQVQARVFTDVLAGSRRVRIRISHPMDTGLVAGIPAFHLEKLEMANAQQQVLWRLFLHEPVAENPVLTFELPLHMTGELRLTGQDNNGNRVDARVQA